MFFVYIALMNKTKNYIIGIDPGKNGGITAIYHDKIIDISKMPSSPEALYEHFLYLGLPNNYKGKLSIYIEDVHSMPTDGSKQAFTFGRGLGQIEGVIAAMGLLEALKRISPMRWMSHFELKRNKAEKESKTEFKNKIKKEAIKLAKQPLILATCDSYMIALYASQLEKKMENHKCEK